MSSPSDYKVMWENEVVQETEEITVNRRLLYRDPATHKLVGCNVDKILPELRRIIVTIGYVDKVRLVLPYRHFVKYDASLVDTSCNPYVEPDYIPPSARDDPHKYQYQLALILSDVPTELRFEAVRRLPFLDDTKAGLLCVFEIITGKIHYLTRDGLFNYEPALATQKRVDLQMNYSGNRVTFPQETIWDEAVINSHPRTVKYNTSNGLQTVERILQLPEQEVSVIKFKNGDSLLVHDDEIEEDNSPMQTSTVTDDDMNRRLNELREQIVADLTENKEEDAKDANNGSLGRQTVRSATISPYTPKLGIRNKVATSGNVLMNRLASYGAGTVTKAYATHRTVVASNNRMNGTNQLNQFSLSPININRTFSFRNQRNNGDDDDEPEDDEDEEEPNNGDNGNNPPHNQQNHGDSVHLNSSQSSNSTSWSIRFKISDVKLRYYGRRWGRNEDLQRKIKEWQDLAELYGIPSSEWYKIWVSVILRGAAKNVQVNDRNHQQNIFKLWELLRSRFPVESKLEMRIERLANFQYKGRRTMKTHITNFVNLTTEIDEDIETRIMLNDEGRLPNNLPNPNSIYDSLMNSIRNVSLLHTKTQAFEYERNNRIHEASYERTLDDIDGLQQSMLKAEQAFYPNGRLQKHDCRDTTPVLHPRYRYFAQYGRVSPRRLRYQRNEAVRNRIRDAHRRRYGQFVQATGCYACGRNNHRVKDCKDKTKRDQWCMENKACYYCTGRGHRARDCVIRNRDQKSKEEGGSTDPASRPRRPDANNDDSNQRRGHDPRGRHANRGNGRGRNYRGRGGRHAHDRASWRRNENGQGRGSRFNNSRGRGIRGNNSRGRGSRDTRAQRQFAQQTDEAHDQSDQQPQRLAYQRDFVDDDEATDPELDGLYAKQFVTQTKINAKQQRGRRLQKQHQLLQSTDIRYDVNYHGVRWSQIPSPDTAEIDIGRKYDSGFIKQWTLIDTGSSISTVTPTQAKKLLESSEWSLTKGDKNFKVENGGEKEEVFSGDYVELPVRIVGTEQWKMIRFYVMPHDHCSFEMILGIRDMKKVGYDLATRVSDDTLIFKHSSRRNKLNYVETKEQILEKVQQMGDEFACYQLFQQPDLQGTRSGMHSREVKEREDSEEDGRPASRRL